MANERHREEAINTQLALVLARHGIDAEPETIQLHGRQRPDVVFMLGGLRVILEGKFADVPDAAQVVLGDAQSRIHSGICHLAVAIVYPTELRTTPITQLARALAETPLRLCILSESSVTDWSQATPGDLLAGLRRVQQSLIEDDIVASSAQALGERIDTIAQLWRGQSAAAEKLARLLGMPAGENETATTRDARHDTVIKVAALVLANAMLFQEQLSTSGGDLRVKSLRAYDSDPSLELITTIQTHWHWIWTKINYVPIFQIGEAILAELPINQPANSAVRQLVEQAKQLCANQSALRHDLMGRIYHWLLYHAKYLGTYYTSTSAATLLLKLTMAQDWGKIDFGDPAALVDFTVADLACGTGTLLMAAGQALADCFVEARVRDERSLVEKDWTNLHTALMENVLHGYDVLPSAVHLTASTLGMLSPHITYRRMNLFIMPMGARAGVCRLGSLDFISQQRVATQLTLDREEELQAQQTGVAKTRAVEASVPMLDLCTMNPPFVRSVGGNLLFGSLPDVERKQLQIALKDQVKSLQASITAGLGSVFLAIADKYLKVNGRLAFVLPVAMATGEAWGASRALLAQKYHVELVIVSHDPARVNFSENTDLSELLFIARKRAPGEPAGATRYVNLWHNPATLYEAMDLAERVRACEPPTLEDENIVALRNLDGRILGEVIALPASEGAAQWLGVQFAQAWTLRVAGQLQRGRLAVPGKTPVDVALCPLGTLGTLGYDRRDIHDAFTHAPDTWSPIPAFWNHNAKQVTTLHQSPNAFLHKRTQAASGRRLKDADMVASSAGRVLLVERLWPITHRVMAVGFDQPVLGNTWWALQADLSPAQEQALLLWLNSTPALVLLLARRVATRSAWMQIKKPAWSAMPVLDVRALAPDVLAQLAAAYDALALEPLQALAKLDSDPIRAKIDGALSATLGWPDLQPLRQLLAREPGLTGKGLSPKPGQMEMAVEVSHEPVQLRLF